MEETKKNIKMLDLLKTMCSIYYCDEGIKCVCYKNKIEFYEIVSEYTYISNQLKEVTVPTSYYHIATFGLDDDSKITTLSRIAMLSLVTTSNYKACSKLVDLVDTVITDYNEQPIIKDEFYETGVSYIPDNDE